MTATSDDAPDGAGETGKSRALAALLAKWQPPLTDSPGGARGKRKNFCWPTSTLPTSRIPPAARPTTRQRVDALALELDGLQNLFYADGRCKVLVVLQGIDTSGKDGTRARRVRPHEPAGRAHRRPGRRRAERAGARLPVAHPPARCRRTARSRCSTAATTRTCWCRWSNGWIDAARDASGATRRSTTSSACWPRPAP